MTIYIPDILEIIEPLLKHKLESIYFNLKIAYILNFALLIFWC